VAPHLFTTRQLQLSSAEDWSRIAAIVGATRAASLNQVHGRDVVVIRRGSAELPGRPAGDAFVSGDPDTAVFVRAADCVPLLIADSRTGAVAAAHAGWRGTAAGVATATVAALSREFNSKPEDLTVAIGPNIGPCCYEVGSELVDAFAAAGHARHLVDRWFSTRDPGIGTRDPRHRRLYLDVAGANRDQLMLAGVPEASIHIAGLCTAMHLDILTSYRAEKEKAVRIAGAIRCRV
jgi:YfiH family protein